MSVKCWYNIGVATAPASCINNTHLATKAVEEQRENTLFNICSLFRGSVPVGAVNVSWRSFTRSMEKTLELDALPSLSHQSFNCFAAFNAFSTKRHVFHNTHVNISDEVKNTWTCERTLIRVIQQWAQFPTLFPAQHE